MPDPETTPAPAATAAGPSLSELRVPVTDLPRVHEALARALGDAGVGGQELNVLFGSGVRAVCAGCGLPVSGAELGELTVPGEQDRDRALPPKLERLRLGFCPRNGCEARFFNVEITGPGRFDRGQVLARTRDLLEGKSGPQLTLKPLVSSATRKATQRLALITLATLFIAFVVYRITFYWSQPIPFVQPKSPFAIEPKSMDPNQK